MADQIVITEKSSQAKDVRAAIGSRYGDVLPAEGHLFDLLEPEDVVPAWKRWSPILLRPEGLYGTRPAEGGNKAAKLKDYCPHGHCSDGHDVDLNQVAQPTPHLACRLLTRQDVRLSDAICDCYD
jgi:hypothetical protein